MLELAQVYEEKRAPMARLRVRVSVSVRVRVSMRVMVGVMEDASRA